MQNYKPDLLPHVRALEGKTNRARGEYVLSTLKSFGLKPSIQKCLWPRIVNIIVDFSIQPGQKYNLFSAHYDGFERLPAANDNASGVAVLLGACDYFRHSRKPVRVVFFDREEAWFHTKFLKMGLLGSFYYVSRTRLHNIENVYNLEFCGSGDTVVVWPVQPRDLQLEALGKIRTAASLLNLKIQTAYVPAQFASSDHLPFCVRGISNSLTLSLFQQGQLTMLNNQLSGMTMSRLLAGWRPAVPEPLSQVHTQRDNSSNLDEFSLERMLALVTKLVDIS